MDQQMALIGGAGPVRWRRRGPRPRALRLYICPGCGNEYAYLNRRPQGTCSRACRARVNNWKRAGINGVVDPEQIRIRQLERWRRKNYKRRAMMRTIGMEPYTLAEIAERDGYRCGLCYCKVRMDLTMPNPKSPTIDHVIPLVCGGEDTRANVQLAHFGCNSKKRDRGSQQLALIG